MKLAQSTTNFFYKHHKIILMAAIIIFCLVISCLLVSKYANFGYNAIDLGIYNQVFYNTSQGNWFEFSIHPHSYLGDHFELFIIFLLPFYLIFSSPLCLIILQAVVLGLAAWPLYLIARTKLNRHWSLGIALAWLFNPFILNAAFFEFHILPFATLFLLFTFYFYIKNKFLPFIIFVLISLTIREDVALVILMLGIFALIEKRKLKWILTPIILGGAWFAAAYQLTGYFNQSNNYKFISLYSWLGQNTGEVIKNFFLKPWLVVKQIFSLNNIFLIIGLFIPLAGLPLLKIKYLLPVILIIGQLLLARVSAMVVLQTHYPILIIPFIFIAAIFSLATLISLEKEKKSQGKIPTFIIKNKTIFIAVFIAAILYSWLSISPILASGQQLFTNNRESYSKKIINDISNDESIVASFKFLPGLSNRPSLYSLHYVFLGTRQFSDEPFVISESIDKVIIDFNDFSYYYLQSQNISAYQTQYPTGAARISELLEKNNLVLSKIQDTNAVYEPGDKSNIKLLEYYPQFDDPKIIGVDITLNDNLKLLGYKKEISVTKDNKLLTLNLYWETFNKLDSDYQLEITIRSNDGIIQNQKTYPLGYGFWPTSQWEPDKKLRTNYLLQLPDWYSENDYNISIGVVDIKGYMGLDGLRSATMKITDKKNIGSSILLGL